LSGPAQIAMGQEFSISLGLPAVNQGVTASVEVQFDSAVLQIAGGVAPAGGASQSGGVPGADAGRALIEVRGPTIAGAPPSSTEVRFRVIAKVPQSTQIRVGDVNAVSSAGQAVSVVSPGGHNINILQPQGAAR